jgi:hypothetical protein
VCVPFFEWQRRQGNQQKRAYLRAMLRGDD